MRNKLSIQFMSRMCLRIVIYYTVSIQANSESPKYFNHSLRLLQIQPEFSGSVLTLRAPGMMSISVDLAQLRGKNFRVAVWGQAVPARDCGEEVARWLSRFLLQEDAGFRLVYYPLEGPTREVRKRNENVFPLAKTTDTVSTFLATIRCTRCNNYNLFSESSIHILFYYQLIIDYSFLFFLVKCMYITSNNALFSISYFLEI